MSHEAAHGFWSRYVFSRDHKVIGLQYYFTAMLMALVGGVLALLIRMQLAWPAAEWHWLEKVMPDSMQGGVMKPEFYLALVTMHGTIMVFFVISLALVSGFGNYIIPLQIGARDMAFPFLNMLSYWVTVPAALLMIASFMVEGGAAAAGWTSYPPLSAVKEAVPGSAMGQTLWIFGMALFIVSFTMGSLNFVTTILNLRARGMSMLRLPMTTWTMLVSSIIGLLAFPPLTAAAIMLLFDRDLGTSFFLPAGMVVGGKVLPNQGGSPLLWQHLFWFLGHPEVYVLILPALGIAFDVMAPFVRRPIFGYRPTLVCLWIIAGLSMIVWGHHMYVSGMSPFLGEVFAIGTLAITVPFTVVAFNMMASLWKARFRFDTPLLFVLGMISFLGTGGLGGLFLGNALSDLYLHDTYFVVGHFHFMIGWVTFFGIFAGTYYWFPKMFGRRLDETLGKIHFCLSFVGVYAIFLTMHFIGFTGMMRQIYDATAYDFLKPMAPWNRFVTVAAFALFGAQMIFIANFAWSLLRGRPVREQNPWHANTLEWTTPTPPPHGNWEGSIPIVHRGPYEYGPAQAEHRPQSEPEARSVESPPRPGAV
jgi:cytochrome c oxidase subunit 1